MTTQQILDAAKSAKLSIHKLNTELKNKALLAMADSIVVHKNEILMANASDVANAKGVLTDVMIDRLMLDSQRIDSMAEGIRNVVKLDDPCNKILQTITRDDGLTIDKVSVPFGVIAVIYESRPNVTSDAAALALKSGNVCILRGGKEAYLTSKAIVVALRNALESVGLDKDYINLIDDTSRNSAEELMQAVGYIDLLIPRGGAGLINACVKNAKVPCLQTGTGICHIYIDKDADSNTAIKVLYNAKTSRPSVCNAAEVCLVHKDIAKYILPLIEDNLVNSRIKNGLTPVELIIDNECKRYINGTDADDTSFDTEFLDYKLAIKIVNSVDEAVLHILKHSTCHSEAIITKNSATADLFCRGTDSAAVYVNASTRFTDGGEFGLGCEIGISTQKLHARGPVGLNELNTYKYVITGDGNIR